MADDIKLIGEAYLKIKEAAPANAFAPGNPLQGFGNFWHKHIGGMPKERVDQYWQQAQLPINPNDPYGQYRKELAQRNYENAKAQYEKQQQVATKQQVAYTPPTGGAGQPATATASSSTQAARAGKGSLPGAIPTAVGGTSTQAAPTPSKEDLLKNISATDQAIKNAANPQLQNIQNSDKAIAGVFNKSAQPVAKASAATQQTSAPGRSRSVYQDFVQRRKQLSGRGY